MLKSHTTPHLTHLTTNSTVLLLPVFRSKFRRCVSTVCTLMPRRSAICLLDRPSARHLSNSSSFCEKLGGVISVESIIRCIFRGLFHGKTLSRPCACAHRSFSLATCFLNVKVSPGRNTKITNRTLPCNTQF